MPPPSNPDQPLDPVRAAMRTLEMASIPPHPTLAPLQRGGQIKVNLKVLQCDPDQIAAMQTIYAQSEHYHEVFTKDSASQDAASAILATHGLRVDELDDLGNGWSKRWSSKEGTTQRVLLQCQAGSSTTARKIKDNARRASNGLSVIAKDWKRKAPYDFVGCLAHMDLTYDLKHSRTTRITGVLTHNERCKRQHMTRLPPVPLHDHVYQIAMQQVNEGASMAAIQARNRELSGAKLYHGQEQIDAARANVRYNLLPQDSSRLYRKHARLQGVDMSQLPEYNVDSWLDPTSPTYKSELAAAIFYYGGRTSKEERFKICIQTEDMKNASWTYAHDKQLILDGTFGICDCRVLLFIALGVDRAGKGLPLAFFLFSAPTGNRATHAGYDTSILTKLLHKWRTSLGERDGLSFCPKVAITDTDTKEQGALAVVWPSISLLLCKFHVRQCWTNKRKALLKMGKIVNFPKQQVQSRLWALEAELLVTVDYDKAQGCIQAKRLHLSRLAGLADSNVAARAGLAFLNYLVQTWMSPSLWLSWSLKGRMCASEILEIPIDGVIPTTNHLESFNGVLKRKHIHRWQKGGRRVRFDLLIFLLVTHILPGIFRQRDAEGEYYKWLAERFRKETGGADLLPGKPRLSTQDPPPQSAATAATRVPLAWWDLQLEAKYLPEAKYMVSQRRIGDFRWLDAVTLTASCASSQADVRQHGHPRYRLTMSCYGWGCCSCPEFAHGRGTCKHLWAFCLSLPSLPSYYRFTFPATYEHAAQVYTAICSPAGRGPSSLARTVSSASPPDVTNTFDPPLPLNALGEIAEEVDEVLGETAIVSSDISDREGPHDDASGSDSSESEPYLEQTWMPENNTLSETPALSLNKDAISQQLQSRVKHELKNILPQLHGLASLLDQGREGLTEAPSLRELDDVLMDMQQARNRAFGVGALPARTKGWGRGGRESTPLLEAGGSEKRPRVLPPSPERSQRRQRSGAIH